MNLLIQLDTIYVLAGLVLFAFSFRTASDRRNPHRFTSALFWLLLGVLFSFGSLLPAAVSGALVLIMVAMDGAGRVSRAASRDEAPPIRSGAKVFLPVLMIPLATSLASICFRLYGLDPSRGALIGLGWGSVLAAATALVVLNARPAEVLEGGYHLNDTMGSLNILPQLLASLGVVFATARIGDLVARGIQNVLPESSLLLLILANCLGMALFTIVIGNSFAAFPVMAAGVLVPLIVKPYGIDPALAGILTLTAGSSGTLMTMMAANFNIVPAALLEMRDTYGIIRFQLPYALAMWSSHIILFWAMARLL
jgi:uncharacterized membrane protein